MNIDCKDILLLLMLTILTIMCALCYNRIDKRIDMIEECTKSCLIEAWTNK